MSGLHSFLVDALHRADQSRQRRALTAARLSTEGRIERDGTALIDMSSNDYLGLAQHPLMAQRSAEWALAHGSGSGASRLVTGTSAAHLIIEERIAAFKGTEAALLFPSGWQLNASVLAALVRAAPGTLLFTDRLIHNSLHAGAAGHRQIRFRHNDLDHLEQLLTAHGGSSAPRLIVTESVFSMDGDRADLARLSKLARAHDAFLYLDEAHATGVLGPDGRGLSAECPGCADLVMGTFSKGFGAFGAYVAGSRLLIDYLVNSCGGFIFSTAPPPAMLGAVDAALDLVPTMGAARAHLSSLGEHLRERLSRMGIDTGASSTHIVPVIVGHSGRALQVAERLRENGFMVAPIRPPTVPQGTSRLRMALKATHSTDDIARLCDALEQALS